MQPRSSRSEILLLFTLLAGIVLTALVVDTGALKPFRDEKHSVFLWFGGAVGVLLFFRVLLGRGLPKSSALLGCLLPLLLLATWHFSEASRSQGAFGLVEPGLSAKADYVLRQYTFALAALAFWLGAVGIGLSHRNVSVIWKLLAFVAGIEVA